MAKPPCRRYLETNWPEDDGASDPPLGAMGPKDAFAPSDKQCVPADFGDLFVKQVVFGMDPLRNSCHGCLVVSGSLGV